VPRPDSEEADFRELLNPDSLHVIVQAALEPSLAGATAGQRFQFERKGYFFADPVESAPGRPVFNRIVTLRDSWAKIVQAETGKAKQGR
jgi:glutaminyl-tRNA synthetase